MLIFLQITCLAIISILFVVSIYAAWLGLGPEQSFLEFMKRAGTILPLIGLLTIYGSFLAFILGWKPNVALANWIRARVIVPAFSQVRWLLAISGVLLFALAAVTRFIISFEVNHDAEIVAAILNENFDRADRLIASQELSTRRIADLYFFNDSERQSYFRSTGDPDPNLCRLYHAYFVARRYVFQPVWTRYAFHLSKGACLRVLDDPKNALAEYQRALKLTRWLSAEQRRLTSRRIAALYLRDSKGYSDIPDQTARLKRVLALLATDPDATAVRMRGTALYFLGEYSKATQEWEEALRVVASEDYIEKKRLLNNLGLTYRRIDQNALAMERIDSGLSLPYDVKDERQRREQIRLLASKLNILRNQRRCRAALDVFEERERLKVQERSPCTALIETQIRACIVDKDKHTPSDRKQLLDALLFGIGQDVASFVDYTKQALTALVDQSAIKFNECYLGLVYDRDSVQRAILKLVLGG